MKNTTTNLGACRSAVTEKRLIKLGRCLVILALSLASTTGFSQKIAAGWSHSLYLCNNGSTTNAWGADTSGQLGNGVVDLLAHAAPGVVNGLTSVKAIRAGYQHCIALRNDSTVWTWGSNTFGQLGNGTTSAPITAPVKVTGLTGIIAVSGGQAGSHSLALKKDGTVWAWGKNTDGQLGDGTTTNSNVPVQVTGLTGIVAIAGGEFHSLAIKNDGTAWAWGKNDLGQLGNGVMTATATPTPVQVTGLTGVKAIAGGRFFSFAIRSSDSTVWCWGQNGDGQLGNGTTTQSSVPVQVTGLTKAIAIAGSAFHCLALKSDGTIRSWGRGVDGQLGDGLATLSSVPVQVSGLTNVVEIVSGTNYSFCRKANDSLYAWGRNIYGQLGDGTSGNYRNSPVAVAGLCPKITLATQTPKIAAGWSHSYNLCNNGSTTNAWGADTSGQLGNGVVDMLAHPVPGTVNGLLGVKSIRAGYQHGIALRNDSTVWTWGSNTFGQLGNGTTSAPITAPVKVIGLTGIIAVSGGQAGSHSLALKKDGTVWAWGKNTDGQLGNGTTTNSNVPIQVTGLIGIIAIAGGEFHSLAIKNDGTAWAWGKNDLGQLGNGVMTATATPTPVQVTGLTGVKAIAGGRFFSFAIKSDSTVWCWGQNGDGQLGNGTTTQSSVPVQVTGLTKAISIAGSAFHCLALKSDGTIRSWGRGVDGQLGDGLATLSSVPVQVSGLTNVVEIVSGTNYSFCRKANDSLYAWGRNIYGQLGDGTSGNYRNSPVAVVGLCPKITAAPFKQKISAGWSHSLYLCKDSIPNSWGANGFGQLGDAAIVDKSLAASMIGLTNVKAIVAGYQHSLALKYDSTLWVCGNNTDGQLGDGTNISKSTPFKLNGLSGIIAMSGGTAGFHTLVLKADGTVWAWGKNTDGQLGNGTTTNSNVPVQVTGLTGIVAIAGGEYHSLAIKNDGTAWAWGRNDMGQLGDGSTVNKTTPVSVSGLTGIKSIRGGRYFSLALKNDSTVWTWGENLYGQLGDGTTVNKSTPVKVPGLTRVTAIAGAAFHCLVIKNDSTMRAWGRNTYGNIGDNTVIDRYTPVMVNALTKVTAIAGGTNYSLAMKSNDSLFAWGRNVLGQLGDGTQTQRNIPTGVVSLCTVFTSTEQSDESGFIGIAVYPNPSCNGKFNVQMPGGKMDIYNMMGERVLQSVVDQHMANKPMIIDLSSQPAGIYSISVKSGENTYYQKLVKQ
jgi:alpha-tubulin suppressor-like RCC1 family protein